MIIKNLLLLIDGTELTSLEYYWFYVVYAEVWMNARAAFNMEAFFVNTRCLGNTR